ncbi:MAG: hypothetical protein HOI23_22190, partial [Deltaproteobacteria bacterium]|nr:hypothetical protein [Deltaproteobacteria bacterium]
NVEDSLHNVRSYAQMLKADVEKADHKGWVDARKENIQEVQSQLKQFNDLKANYELDLSGFLKELSTLEKSVSNAPVSETKKNLHERLQSLPRLLDVKNPLAEQDLTSLSTDLKEESSQIKNEFNQLSRSIRIIQKKVGALENEISGVTSERDIEAVREKLGTLSSLIKRHNSDARTQLRLADRVLDKLTGPTLSRDTTFVVPKLSKNGKTLLDHISRGKDPFFGTMNISKLSYSSGRKITFTTDDRIAVWDSLLKKDASIDINKPNRSGNTMIHQIIMSAGMDESDKVRMVEYLGSKGADLNIKSRDGLQPVELALRLSVKQPELVETLRDLGAQISLKEQIPIFAHLIGAGGEVSLKKGGKVQRVALEGLSPNVAAFGLDPAFVESLDELQSRTDGPINSIYQRMERGWVNTMSYEKFIGRVRDAKIGIDTKGGVPEVLSTGWDHPSGHAISFVFNHEPDGYYFYACNTGDAKDPDRSIVKYKVSDFDNFLSFLKTSSRNADHTRSLYVGQPERLGLDRVPEKDQLPASIDKSSQKIGNCTVASRKAALLAMMWSEGRDFSIPPQELKSAYKEVTTELRERGIRGAISSGHMDLMGKSLVKMLTKFDRPACQDYAFELASAMVRKSAGQKAAPSGGKPESAPPADSTEYLNTLGRAVQIGELNLQQRSSNGQTLAEHARSEGNLKAANILDQLAKAA